MDVPRRYRKHLSQEEDLQDLDGLGAGQWDGRSQAIQRADDSTTWILIGLWTLPHLLLLIDVVTRKYSPQEEGFLDSVIRPDWADVFNSTRVVDTHRNASYKDELCFSSEIDTKESIWHYNSTCKQKKKEEGEAKHKT